MFIAKGIQKDIRERFYRHVGVVPAGTASVEEGVEPSPPEVDWGEKLTLRLVPSSKDKCGISLFIAERYCTVYVGRHAEFEFDPHFTKDVAGYVDDIDKLVQAAVHGTVSEIDWLWRGRVIYSVTSVRFGPDAIESGPVTRGVFRVLFRLFRGLQKRETCYEAYTADKP